MLNQLRYPVWQEPYLATMVEMDSAKMKAKIAFAEDAIRVCMIDGEAEPAEREAILDALNALKFIKRWIRRIGDPPSKVFEGRRTLQRWL